MSDVEAKELYKRAGIKDTDSVVREATKYGAPKGYNANRIYDEVINIDPDSANGLSVRLGDLAKMSANQKFSPAIAANLGIINSANIAPEETVIIPKEELFSSFVGVKEAAENLDKNKEVVYNENSESTASRIPTKEVLFEIQNIGTNVAFYHAVVISDEHIILVYDNTFKHGHRYFPPVELAAPMACMCKGNDSVFLVEPTNIQFDFGNYSFCIFAIKQKATAEV